MLSALAFIFFNFLCYVLGVVRGPYWVLLACINVYFNSPQEDINWWAAYLPFLRWSLLSSVFLILAMIIHWKKLVTHEFYSFKWAGFFLVLTVIITITGAVDPDDAFHHTYILFSYIVIAYCLIRGIESYKQYRFFLLTIILMATNLSINAYLYGERVHARLENIGTGDTFGSNQFALLLVGIIPFTIPFIVKGRWWERGLCIFSLPFLVNAFILCNSRGAFVAGGLSVILAVVLIRDKQIRKVMLLAGIVFVPLLIYLADEFLIERLSTLLAINSAIQDGSQAQQLSSGRTEIWGYGLQMVNDYPFGAGPNGFKNLARFYMPPEVLTFHPGDEFGVRAAHNTYLQVLVEQGYIGLVVWLCLCFHTCYLLFSCLRIVTKKRWDNLFWKLTIFSLSISYFSIILGGVFSSRVYYEFFWWQLALVIVGVSFVKRMMLSECKDVECFVKK